MTIIYLPNSLVNGTWNTICKMKYKFYLYQNWNLSLSKYQSHLYRKSNLIFIKNQMISLIKYQILSLSKTKFYIYQK